MSATRRLPAVQRASPTGRGNGDAEGTGADDIEVVVDKVLRRVRDQLRLDRERRGTIADRKP